MNNKNLLDHQPFLAGVCACMCITPAAGRPAPGRGTAAVRAVRGPAGAGEAVTPPASHRIRGKFTLDFPTSLNWMVVEKLTQRNSELGEPHM